MMANTRRSLLASIPAAAALGVVVVGPVLAAAAHPDAQLVADVAEALAVDAAEWTLVADVVPPFPADVQAESDRLCGRWFELLERIVTARATTPAGVQAKARLMHNLLPKDEAGNLHGANDSTDDRVAWSLVRDILGGQA